MNAATPQIKIAFQKHQLKQAAISASKQLNLIIQNVQRHRAASVATLAGDQVFEALTWQIENDIINQLKALSNDPNPILITEPEIEHIYYEWLTIRQHWRQDNEFDNFKIHCHFIEQLLRQNQLLSDRSEQRTGDLEQDALVALAMEKLPYLVELIAQARGLATHCAATSRNTAETRSRLRFLAGQIDSHFKESTRSCADCSYPVFCKLSRQIKHLNPDTLVKQFILTIQSEFVDTETPGISSADIYQQGCNLVSAISQQLNKALLLLGQTSSPDLTRWIMQKD